MAWGNAVGATMPFTRHAAERAAERYGLVPSVAEWGQAILDITDTVLGLRSGAVLLARKGMMERWLVNIGGAAMIAIYDPSQAAIITVQPPKLFPTKRSGITHRSSKFMKGRRPERRRQLEGAE